MESVLIGKERRWLWASRCNRKKFLKDLEGPSSVSGEWLGLGLKLSTSVYCAQIVKCFHEAFRLYMKHINCRPPLALKVLILSTREGGWGWGVGTHFKKV